MKHSEITAAAELTGDPRPTGLQRAEGLLEAILFGSRWLMAPFYLLMVVALGMLLVKFTQECWHIVTHTLAMTESDAVLAVLSLIDIALFAGMRTLTDNEGARAVTLELSTQFIGAGQMDAPLDAVVEVLKETRRTVFMRGHVEQSDHLVAAFSGLVRKAPN